MAKSPQELARLLDRCTTFLAAHDDSSADPAKPVKVAQVRLAIAHILGELHRREESLVATNALVDYCSGHEDDEVAQKWLGHALIYQTMALLRLGRMDEAAAVSAEIIVRFRDCSDPALRPTVGWALSNRSRLLMRNPNTFAQGLEVSDELIELMLSEPEESALELAEVALAHMRALLSSTTGRLEAVACLTLQTLLANLATAGRSAARRLPARVTPRLARIEALGGGLHSARLANVTARAEQAMRVERAIRHRMATIEDPRAGRVAAQAEMLGVVFTWILGDIPGGIRTMQAMNERRDPDVAAAYDAILDEDVDLSSRLGQMRAATLLNQRAEALIGDEPALARIAYEDSVAARLPSARSWPVRWVISLLTPRG